MHIQIATKASVRLLISIFYLGSLLGFITYLGMKGVDGLSWYETTLLVASVAAWAAASMHNVYRRVSTKVWEVKHGSVEGEITLLRPSTHATINSSLHMVSSMSSIGSILCRAPNLSMIEVLRVPGYGLWFSAALHQCVLARTVERRREKLPNEKHTLCGLRPEAHMIMAVAQIESAGAVLGAAIWLNDVLYASRLAGNISWLLGASIALSLAAYEYVEVQRESVKQEVTLDEVKVEEVEDVTDGSSYKL